jgi:N-acetylglucosaminyldiphosphoundecaprenol N-acetyl-beta-D-mannosaminyltransferase
LNPFEKLKIPISFKKSLVNYFDNILSLMKKRELLSLNISVGSYADFINNLLEMAQLRQSKYTCFANVHMLIEGHNDPSFANVINNANLIAPDGKALTWALRILYGLKQDRVAGMDILPDLLQQASDKKLSVYFYGGSEELLIQSKIFIMKHYPGLITAGFNSPPFRELTPEEEQDAIQKINASGANLVFVVLGCPKQEKWMAAMLGKIDAVMLGIGGALPVMVGVQKRAPKWMQEYGLEWLYRLKQEPSRLFFRYAITNPLFVYLFFKEYIRLKILRMT